MQYKIQLKNSIKIEVLLDSLESEFIQNQFIVNKQNNTIWFERKMLHDKAPSYQMLHEIFRSFVVGSIQIYPSTNTLICKTNYYKHLAISALLGVLTSFIFSVMLGGWASLIFKIGLPITLLCFIAGIFSGNAHVESLLKKVLNKYPY